MSDWVLLYVLTRIDALGVFFEAALGAMAAVAFALTLAILCSEDRDGYIWDKDSIPVRGARRDKWRKWRRCALVLLPLFCVMRVALPSRNDIIFIVGGTVLIEAAKSPRAQALGSRSLDVIEKYLDDAAKDGASK
jgi:hypothetical protein